MLVSWRIRCHLGLKNRFQERGGHFIHLSLNKAYRMQLHSRNTVTLSFSGIAFPASSRTGLECLYNSSRLPRQGNSVKRRSRSETLPHFISSEVWLNVIWGKICRGGYSKPEMAYKRILSRYAVFTFVTSSNSCWIYVE